MPLPDNNRERGGATQGTQQSVAPSVAMPGTTSPNAGPFTGSTTKLQINPNQARVVRTGGELAEMFAQVATGAQKGIQAFEQMEKLVEESRYTEFETEYLRQYDTVKGDPQKMKTWMEGRDYQPGRHTAKKYWTLRAEINGKAYEDEQADYVRDTIHRGATMPPAERIKLYRETLGRLDENSKAYGVLDNALVGDVQRQSAANRKMSLDMKSAEFTGLTQDRVRTLIDIGGVNPDIADHEYFKNLLRAANMGLARVSEDGKFFFGNREISMNELTTELNAEVMDAIGAAAEQMSDPDLAMTMFNSITYDEGFLAEARRRTKGGSGSSEIDAITSAKNAALSNDDGAASSVVMFLSKGISGNRQGPEARDDFTRMAGKFTKEIVNDTSLDTNAKLRALAALEQSLVDPGDGTAADTAWDSLASQYGIADGFVSEGMRDLIRRDIQDARLEVTVAEFDNAPDPSQYTDFNEYQTDMKNFIYQRVGLLAEVAPDSHIMVRTRDDRSMSIPTDKFRDWAARNRDLDIEYVQLNQPGNGPVGMDIGAAGVTTFSYSGANDPLAESLEASRHQIPSAKTNARLKSARELKLATMWNNGEDIPEETREDAFKEAIKRNPNAAMEQIRRREDGPEMLVRVSTDKDAAIAIERHFNAIFDFKTAPTAEAYIARVTPYASLFDAMGDDKARSFFGVLDPNPSSPSVSLNAARGYTAARYADVIFDDFKGPLSEADTAAVQLRIDSVLNAQKLRSAYPGEVGAKLDTIITYTPGDENSERYAQRAGVRPYALAVQQRLVEFANAETGQAFTSIAEVRDSSEGARALRKAEAEIKNFGAVLEVQADLQRNVAGDAPSFATDTLTIHLNRILTKATTPPNPNLYFSPDGSHWTQTAVGTWLKAHRLDGDLNTENQAEMGMNALRAGQLVRAQFPDVFFENDDDMAPGEMLNDMTAVRALQAYNTDGPQAMYDILETSVLGSVPYRTRIDFEQNPKKYPALLERLNMVYKATRRFSTDVFTATREAGFDNPQLALQRTTQEDGTVSYGGAYRGVGFVFTVNPEGALSNQEEWLMTAAEYNSGGHIRNNGVTLQQPMDRSYIHSEDGPGPLLGRPRALAAWRSYVREQEEKAIHYAEHIGG